VNEEDCEEWLLAVGVIASERERGGLQATDLQQLVLRVWWLDYGMRNAGDLATVLEDACPDALINGSRFARACDLPIATAVLGQSQADFERTYFDNFVSLCGELRQAWTHDS